MRGTRRTAKADRSKAALTTTGGLTTKLEGTQQRAPKQKHYVFKAGGLGKSMLRLQCMRYDSDQTGTPPEVIGKMPKGTSLTKSGRLTTAEKK